jgi:hypothetical protein
MRYEVKIIPKATPNDQGKWIEIDGPSIPPDNTRWRTVSDLLSPHIPDDHFLAAYRRSHDHGG